MRAICMSLALAILIYLLLAIVMSHAVHRYTAPIATPIVDDTETAETADFIAPHRTIPPLAYPAISCVHLH
jgi:hypothetical protein